MATCREVSWPPPGRSHGRPWGELSGPLTLDGPPSSATQLDPSAVGRRRSRLGPARAPAPVLARPPLGPPRAAAPLRDPPPTTPPAVSSSRPPTRLPDAAQPNNLINGHACTLTRMLRVTRPRNPRGRQPRAPAARVMASSLGASTLHQRRFVDPFHPDHENDAARSRQCVKLVRNSLFGRHCPASREHGFQGGSLR